MYSRDEADTVADIFFLAFFLVADDFDGSRALLGIDSGKATADPAKDRASKKGESKGA
jgi:hypothetical protein